MVIIKFDVYGEVEIKGIPQKDIEMFKYSPKSDILEVKMISGAYEIYNGVKKIEILEV